MTNHQNAPTTLSSDMAALRAELADTENRLDRMRSIAEELHATLVHEALQIADPDRKTSALQTSSELRARMTAVAREYSRGSLLPTPIGVEVTACDSCGRAFSVGRNPCCEEPVPSNDITARAVARYGSRTEARLKAALGIEGDAPAPPEMARALKL